MASYREINTQAEIYSFAYLQTALHVPIHTCRRILQGIFRDEHGPCLLREENGKRFLDALSLITWRASQRFPSAEGERTGHRHRHWSEGQEQEKKNSRGSKRNGFKKKRRERMNWAGQI